MTDRAVAGVRSGLFFPLFDELADPMVFARLAAEAEAAGWHGVFVWDQVRWHEPIVNVADPQITLAAITASTERILVGPMVTPLDGEGRRFHDASGWLGSRRARQDLRLPAVLDRTGPGGGGRTVELADRPRRPVRRFDSLQRLPTRLGIATNVLKARLDGFVEAGIMRRHQYSVQPELHEYLLTEKGRDLAPALIALTKWGDRWAAPDGPPILYRHTVCGADVGHEIVCATCGPLEAPAEVQVRPGPGMPAEQIGLMEKLQAGRSGSRRARWRSVASARVVMGGRAVRRR